MTLVFMAERRLETKRFLVLARDLERELGSRNAAAEAIGIDPGYITHLRSGKRENIGGDVRKRAMLALDLDGRFFDLETLGDEPYYGDHQGQNAPVLRHVELDTEVRTALAELLDTWDDERHERPTADEIEWMNTKLDFRQDKRVGYEITPRLLFDRLMEWRRQQRGKTVPRPRLAAPAARSGTRKLAAVDAERKKRKGR